MINQRLHKIQDTPLPKYLANMILFKVNTGCREQEVCKLQWDWEVEVEVPELNTSIFIIPAKFGGRNKKVGIKNGEDRVVVLNRVARSVIDAQRESALFLYFHLTVVLYIV